MFYQIITILSLIYSPAVLFAARDPSHYTSCIFITTIGEQTYYVTSALEKDTPPQTTALPFAPSITGGTQPIEVYKEHLTLSLKNNVFSCQSPSKKDQLFLTLFSTLPQTQNHLTFQGSTETVMEYKAPGLAKPILFLQYHCVQNFQTASLVAILPPEDIFIGKKAAAKMLAAQHLTPARKKAASITILATASNS